MTNDDLDFDAVDDDFQRWYVGGSPPEFEGWPRHAFADAFEGLIPQPSKKAWWLPDEPCGWSEAAREPVLYPSGSRSTSAAEPALALTTN